MWVLEGASDRLSGKRIYLECNKTLKVSRSSSTEICLGGDSSISRDHGTLHIIHERKNLNDVKLVPKIVLKDHKSKFGTYISDGVSESVKIKPSEPYTLKDGDFIRFGLLDNTWKVVHIPLVLATSQLPDNAVLLDTLVSLGGYILPQWTGETTHLVMERLLLTSKTVCALASAKPIVIPQYFLDLLTSIRRKNLQHPEVSDYLPPLHEPSLQNIPDIGFEPDERRKHLFYGMHFIFSSQSGRMKSAVELSGGNYSTLSDDNLQLVAEDSFIFVHTLSDPHCSPLSSRALKLLKSKSRRSIPETEVGLSILFIDKVKHCNPCYDSNNMFKRTLSVASNKEPVVLAPDTQHNISNQSSEFLSPSKMYISETVRTSGRTSVPSASLKPTLKSSDLNVTNYNTLASTCLMDTSLSEEPGTEGTTGVDLSSVKPTRTRTQKENILSRKRGKVSDETNEVQAKQKNCITAKDENRKRSVDMFDTPIVQKDCHLLTDGASNIEFKPVCHSTQISAQEGGLSCIPRKKHIREQQEEDSLAEMVELDREGISEKADVHSLKEKRIMHETAMEDESLNKISKKTADTGSSGVDRNLGKNGNNEVISHSAANSGKSHDTNKKRAELPSASEMGAPDASIPFEPYTLPSLEGNLLSTRRPVKKARFDVTCKTTNDSVLNITPISPVTEGRADIPVPEIVKPKLELSESQEMSFKKETIDVSTDNPANLNMSGWTTKLKKSRRPEQIEARRLEILRETQRFDQMHEASDESDVELETSLRKQANVFDLPSGSGRRRRRDFIPETIDEPSPRSSAKRTKTTGGSLSKGFSKDDLRNNRDSPDVKPIVSDSDVKVKQEESRDIKELEQEFQAGMVIEVRSLVKKSNESPNVTAASDTTNGRINYKRFRKVLPLSTTIALSETTAGGSLTEMPSEGRPYPMTRIIGGSDLIVHRETNENREEHFPEIDRPMQDPERGEDNSDDQQNTVFDLPSKKNRKRRRGR